MPNTRRGWLRIAFAAMIIAAASAIAFEIWRTTHPNVLHLNGRDYQHEASCPKRFQQGLVVYPATGTPGGDVVKIPVSEPLTPAIIYLWRRNGRCLGVYDLEGGP